MISLTQNLTSKVTPTTETMPFQVTITETNVSTVCFETEEEAREFMNEPDYDLCDWECIDSKIVLN